MNKCLKILRHHRNEFALIWFVYNEITKKNILDALDHLVIELAWSDKVSFEAIEQQTGKNEKQVIELMRRHLKPSSFKLWRTRVNGRNKKHEKLLPPTGQV